MMYTLVNSSTNEKLVVKTLKGFTVDLKYSAEGTKLNADVYLVSGGDKYYLDCKRASSGCVVRKADGYICYCESDFYVTNVREVAIEILKQRAEIYAEHLKNLIATDIADEKFFKTEAEALNQVKDFKEELKNIDKNNKKRSHKKGGKK